MSSGPGVMQIPFGSLDGAEAFVVVWVEVGIHDAGGADGAIVVAARLHEVLGGAEYSGVRVDIAEKIHAWADMLLEHTRAEHAIGAAASPIMRDVR